jgi:hypothetical protein
MQMHLHISPHIATNQGESVVDSAGAQKAIVYAQYKNGGQELQVL